MIRVAPVVLAEGILLLASAEVRERIDTNVFVDVDVMSV
ncbi:MAG: uridine kinase [Nitriliruptoraceae bacterium]|jgi:uridine kinase